MAGVSGVGQTTGNMYIGTGSNRFLSVQLTPNHQYPGGPVRANRRMRQRVTVPDLRTRARQRRNPATVVDGLGAFNLTVPLRTTNYVPAGSICASAWEQISEPALLSRCASGSPQTRLRPHRSQSRERFGQSVL